jgi:hypothetical protein
MQRDDGTPYPPYYPAMYTGVTGDRWTGDSPSPLHPYTSRKLRLFLGTGIPHLVQQSDHICKFLSGKIDLMKKSLTELSHNVLQLGHLNTGFVMLNNKHIFILF